MGTRDKSVRHFWRALRHWFRVNTFAPSWIGKQWAHPLLGICVAILSQLVVLGLRQVLIQLFPQAVFYSALSLFSVAFIALSWGAGPSIISTLMGALLLDFFILPSQLGISFNSSDVVVSDLVYLLSGFAISALASQTERARRNAQALAGSLEQERARLETILEAIPDVVALYDAQGKLFWLNHKGRQTVGPVALPQSAEEMPTFYAMRTPAGIPLSLEQLPIIRALKGETVEGMELRYQSSRGQELDVMASAAPLLDAQGQVESVVSITHDLGALRLAEREAARRAKELEATSSLLEAVIEAITDGVFVYDAEGHIQQINQAARAFLERYLFDDGILLPLEQRVATLQARDEFGQELSPEQFPAARVLRGEVLNGANSPDMVLPITEGGSLQLNMSGGPIRDASGQQLGAVLVARDVTERRRLERRTQEALEAMLLMAQALVQMPPTPDESVSPEAPNEAAQRLVELTRRILGCQRVSMVAVELETGQQRPIATIGLTPEEEARWWREQPHTRFGSGPDPSLAPRLLAGESIIVNTADPLYRDRPNPYGVQTLLAAPIRLGERLIGVLGIDYGGIAHTFTREEIALAGAVSQLGALVLERERLLRERAEAQAKMLSLQETTARMDEFLSIVSHELRTPVTSIKTGMQLMQRRITSRSADDPEALVKVLQDQERSLQRSNQQIQRLTHLLDDLIDISRIRTGKIDIQPTLCDLGALVRDIVEEERLTHPDRVISLEIAEETPLQVQVDANRIGQVLTNYLTNALKYSLFDRPVEVGARAEGQQARVWVRDQGPGIPPEEQPHIWELFHRVPGIEVKSGSGVGLGLGLHISKTMIERHHGVVGVESTAGEGSTFWFTLPLATSRAADA
jgi:PAS domain S-box-containing protein